VTLSDKVIARNDSETRDALQVKSGALLLLAERTARNEAERADLKARGDATFDQFYAPAPQRTPEQERAAASEAAREQRERDMKKVADGVAEQLKAGRRADAEKAIAAATEDYGKDPLFWQNIAYAWHAVSDTDASVAALMRAADLEPMNPERHHVVATYQWEVVFRNKTLSAAKKQEHITAGLAAADRALALNPEYVEALVYRALLLQQRADLETNAARKKALLDDAAALKARAQAIQAARQKSGG
jgi:tetratricopeptide (TPR) repeat protein